MGKKNISISKGLFHSIINRILAKKGTDASIETLSHDTQIPLAHLQFMYDHGSLDISGLMKRYISILEKHLGEKIYAPIPDHFGERMRYFRDILGFSAKQVADEIDATEKQIISFEKWIEKKSRVRKIDYKLIRFYAYEYMKSVAENRRIESINTQTPIPEEE